jgi:hypothetical protein
MSIATRACLVACAIVCVLAPATAPAQPDGALRSATRAFVIHLDAPAAAVTPLFGPVLESRWSPDWKPRFLHPAVPQQVEGAVFITESAHGPATWLLTRYDEAAGEVRYEAFSPGFALTRIAIAVRPDPRRTGGSEAAVRYTRMALSPAANHYVDEFDAHFESQAPHWEHALNAALHAGHAR